MHNGPWTATDVAVLVVGELAGLLLILLAWYGASGQLTPGRQTAWIAAGAAGIIVAGTGNAAWLGRARRRIGRRRTTALLAPADVLLQHRRADTVPEAGVVSLPGARRYHRPECQLVAGKVVAPATPDAERARGVEPCGVCAP